jgi:ATP-dependent DNA helicase DinG
MLPHASLRLKQGVGRLIRTATDRGAIVLGDPRAVSKSYGRGLIDALPPARRVIAPWVRIVETLREFYGTTVQHARHAANAPGGAGAMDGDASDECR